MAVNKIFERVTMLTFFLFIIGGSFLLITSFVDAHGELNENTITKNHRIWIWSLSELSDDYAKNYCLNYALFNAAKIAQSHIGQEAFQKVTKPGQLLTKETVDKVGKFPQIQVKNLVDKWAQYEPDGENENSIYLDVNRLNSLLELCKKPDMNNNVVLFLEVTILHETAHWADNILKHSENIQPDNLEYKVQTNGDTPGEEGSQLEKDLFGGIISISSSKDRKLTEASRLFKDGQLVDEFQKEKWFNFAFWNKG